MKAVTLSYDMGGLETAGPESESDIFGGNTGDATIAALLGETSPSVEANGDAAGLGGSLGALAGAGLGSLVGPAGTALGAGLGKVVGDGVERLVQSAAQKSPPSRPAKKRLSKNETRILAEGDKMTQRTGNKAYAEEASLRVYRPAEYTRRRAAGTLPTQHAPQSAKAPPSSKAPASKPNPPSKPNLTFPAAMVQAARRPSTAMPPEAIAPQSYEAPPEYEEPAYDEMVESEDEYNEYNETAAPDARPNPVRHVSVTPLPQKYMEALVRDVPAVRNLDPRLLRLASGNVNVARDVSGVDPTTGTYHALPGETPAGITKKLTGQVERMAELLAANPGKPAVSPVWNIPPGWLVYDRETGALTTARKYVVLSGDSPYSIAKKLGAAGRPKWFAELSAANPQKQVKNGNFASLFPGEELGVPDTWPETPLAVSTGNTPQPSQQSPATQAQPAGPSPAPNPGLPGPGQNSTMDPGAILQVQLMLARWGRRVPNAINPLDYGTTYDFTSTMTPRTVQAIQSFQLWWNREHPLRALRMDGALDNDTMSAMKEAEQVASMYGQLPGGIPTPPDPGQTKPPSLDQIPRPYYWPADMPWPPIPAPNQSRPQPQPQPQPKIGEKSPGMRPDQPPQNVPDLQTVLQKLNAVQEDMQALRQQMQDQLQRQPGPAPQPAPARQPMPQPPPSPAQQTQLPQTAPSSVFPPLDINLTETDRQNLQAILINETRPEWLAWLASIYDGLGYPLAAAALRTRMNALLAPLDANMPEDQKQIVRSILQNEMRPDMLEMSAGVYEAMGYPYAGQALRQRAAYRRGGQAQPTPDDLPNLPVVTHPDNAPQTNNPPENQKSVLPMLALIGAGLAFT